MAIYYDPETSVFILHTRRSTYQMQVGPYGFLLHLYYGARIEDQDLSYLIQRQDRGFSGNPHDAGMDRTFSLDTLPLEYPCFGIGDYRESCLEVAAGDGSNAVDLRYREYRIYPGKTPLEGLPASYGSEDEVQTLEIVMWDPVAQVEVVLQYSVFEGYDAIARSVKIINRGTEPVALHRALSCCLDFNIPRRYDVMTFYGRHASERMVERTPLHHGKIRVDSLRGTSSHQQNPFVILCDRDANEEYGECYGMSFVYSGNFLAQAEVDQIDQVRLVMGIHPQGFQWTLEGRQHFQAPEVILGYSPEGLTALSHHYHALIREHVCRGAYQYKRRPILINNWEATYFDFDEEKLLSIAKKAVALGVELFVLDDGWFGKRDDDNTGLGDWYVNTKKIKSGIDGLSRKINVLGMRFGIWLEPEMVSEDSDLYRAHPDWCLRMPGRKSVRGRNQYVLDMSRSDVTEYLYSVIYGLLSSADIAYVKWDMNRHLSNVYSSVLPAERQGEVWHRYVLGLYYLLERLTQAFPDVLFEGCSGGGGRFDAGMLYYTPQIWCSDNTDAIGRIAIQYGTSFSYPLSTMGSHVSACPNHQTGRTTPMRTRGVVAQTGAFGYELDITRISTEEKQEVKSQIDFFKRNADLISFGTYYRLTDVDQYYAAWMAVSSDRKEALVSYVLIQPKANPMQICIRLKGLGPAMKYREDHTGTCISGDALMKAGLVMPVLFGDYTSLQVHLKAL